MDTTATRFKGSPSQGLAAGTIAFFIGLASVALFGPTAKKLNQTLLLEPAMLGFLIAIPSLTGSLLRIPFGAWVDRIGGRIPNLILLLTSLFGMIGLAIGFVTDQASFWWLTIFGAIAGSGIATFSVGIGQVSYWYPKARQGTALGLYAGIANTSPGIVSFLIPLALTSIGLVNTYLVWLGFLAMGIVVYFLLAQDAWYFQLRKAGKSVEQAKFEAAQQGQELFPSGKVIQSLKTSASYWQTWVLVVIYFTTFGGFLALTAWFPSFWQGLYQIDLVTAGILTAIFSVGASLVRAGSGFVTDRLGGEKSALLALSIVTVGAFIIMLVPLLPAAVLGMVLIAVGMGMNNAATFKIVAAVMPNAMGGASGWIGGLGALGGFVYPIVMSNFLHKGLENDSGYNQGYIIFIISGLLSIALLLALMTVSKTIQHKQKKQG